MPITPSEREKRAYPTDRRASSPKRQSDVTQSKHVVVTKAVYDAIIRGDDKDSNLKTKRLCQGRNLVGKALLVVSGSLKDYQPQITTEPPEMYNQLRQIHRELERAYLKFPLQIENK